MDGVVLKPGEGEALFEGRIVLKADFEQLTITESFFPDARQGAEAHFHQEHADSFYVVEGELAFLIRDEETPLPENACACAPPELVHGFRSTRTTRFLNFHTPDGRFADHLRERDRDEPGGFDSIDGSPDDGGRPASDAIAVGPGERERLGGNNRVATIKIGRDELALIEFELEPGFTGPEPHSHGDHIDSFYVLEGEPEFLMGEENVRLGPGSFVAAPLGIVHTFSNPGPDRARLLNVHAPSRGFHDWLREQS